jgi:NAD(P)-dependent dehydrogenase (short-subunit alcohol dehydrogenase family)
MPRWTVADIPPQAGRFAVVTGANSGIGFETAKALAEAGARVIVAARSEAKGREAAAAIGPRAAWRSLDLADLSSVAHFADTLVREATPIDILILNAGVMALPDRRRTKNGFEMQIGVNFLGHFALAARLSPLMADGSRVVPLASIAAKRGQIDTDDLMAERRYVPWTVYAQSKLAMIVFALEMARRQQRIASIAAHPGFARTNLIANGPGKDPLRDTVLGLFGDLISQSAADGALPVLRAATDPALASGDYIGAAGPFELKGRPERVKPPRAARDPETGRWLWAEAERLTGTSFPL